MLISDVEEVHGADHVLHGRDDVLLYNLPVHDLVVLVEALPVYNFHLLYERALAALSRSCVVGGLKLEYFVSLFVATFKCGVFIEQSS